MAENLTISSRRLLAAALITVLGSGALTGCGSNSGEAKTGAEGRTDVVLGPARIESITNAALIVGVNDKVFEECGINASIKPSGGGGNQIQALQSRAIDVIFPSFSAVITSYLQGAKISVIAGDTVGTNGMVWLTSPDSPLNSVADLRGKKVGISAVGSNTQTMLHRVLRAQGMKPEDVEEVVVADVNAGLAALASKSVDAIWATEPSATIFKNSGQTKVLFRADDYVTDYQLTVTAVRSDYAEQNPELIKNIIQCIRKTRDVASAETDRVAKDFASTAKLDATVAQSVLKALIDNGDLTLDLTVPGIQAVLDSLVEAGSVPAGTTLDSLKGLFAVPDGVGVNVKGGTLP